MDINKIREIESNNWDKIHWFKSGIFWRAYNVSAFLTVQKLRSFKVMHKHCLIRSQATKHNTLFK